jgi:hypothetical protein
MCSAAKRIVMQRSAPQSYSGWPLGTAAFPNRFGSSAEQRRAWQCNAPQSKAKQSIAKHIGKPAMVYRWVFHQWQRKAAQSIAAQRIARQGKDIR